MKRNRFLHSIQVCGALLLAFAVVIAKLCAVEPWADEKLPVKDGLAVWLDAATLKDALPQIGIKFFDLTRRKVETWPDASGNGRHARQANVEFRPVLETSAGGSAVRFDGRNSFLAGAWSAKLDAASVFIVAAPRINGGGFRALAALHPEGRNDYSAGLNIDLGAAPHATLDTINVEGAGTRGAANLLRTRFDLGTFHVFSVEAGADKISLRVDGKDEGSRERKAGAMELSEFLIGARSYSNQGPPPRTQGFFEGDIAEAIIFDRALATDERARVEKYLLEKHGALRTQSIITAVPGAKPLKAVATPAPVQCLMPGFEARELPVQLTNINFIKYRHDGALFAGAYNGKIWLLRDTDGDGIEDQATLYYESPNIKSVMGLAIAPKGCPRGDGVFVATVGHVFFIPEKDGKGEREITVADGWPAPQIVTGGVSDCLGLALDREGGVWFGLGTSDFTRPYLPDPKTGAMTYRIPTERGTIQHVSPDFKTRTTVCTGIRFPVGMAFNSRGDLFCTDQEGATWLPNGNPLDELLHIQPGRHYGFPPRHPKFLPDVVDEPSVFDFSPQHQSTCGLFFNEATGPVFGPAWWGGDAFVCGESRGKLWRVSLAKTEAGYVAQSQLFAHLNMLPIDATLSPRGDLVVTCHSGSPDWGSGPNGNGKIFHIRHAQPGLPKPVFAWPARATESVVTWDRPLTEVQFAEITRAMEITSGPHTRAGDRYESLRPGYQVVSDQLAAPRFDVPVKGVSLSPDRRSIILQTAPRLAGLHYAVQLGGFTAEKPWTPPNAPPPPPKKANALPQENTVDVDHTLNGVEASFEPANKAADTKPIRAVILTGNDGAFHDWLKTSAALRSELERDRRFQVRVVTDPEFLASDELFAADVLVQHYVNWQRPGLSEKAKANLLRFVAEGRGLCVAHFANGAFIDSLPGANGSDWPDYRRVLLRRWWDFLEGSTHDDYAPFRVVLANSSHPITAGLEAFDTTDELYCRQVGDAPLEPLVTAHCVKTGKDEPLAFAFQHGKGRVFQCMLGHSDVSMHCAGELFRRGIAWAAGREPTGAREWKGWLPHADPSVARELTRGSGEHESFSAALKQAGKITVRGQLDLFEMLQPAIQSGAKLDYERPAENVTVRVESSAPFTLAGTRDAQREGARYTALLKFDAPRQEWQPFELKLEKPAGDLALTMTWSTSDDPRPRAFPLRRFFVPWAQREAQTIIADEERRIPELDGGHWLSGRNLFFSKAACFVCHSINGAGGKVGPDLSNLRFRDYASVLRDIREPSAAINPDFAAYVVQTGDGATLTGVLGREKDGAIKLTDAAGQIHNIPRTNLKSLQALTVSLMPEKLLDALSADEQRDLMTFLLQPPIEPAPLMIEDAPPPRKMDEVKAILGDALTVAADAGAKPLRIVLCASDKDAAHNKPGFHDYPLWRTRWTRLLNMADGITAEPANDWPADEQWRKADVIAFNSWNPAWALERDAAKIAKLGGDMDKFLARGGGIVFIHYAMNAGPNAGVLAQRLGLAWAIPPAKFRHGASDWVLDKNHPLAAGFSKFEIPDESYWHLTGDLAAAKSSVLTTSVEENAPTPQMWTREAGPGRVFVSIPGHYTWTHDDPLYRILIFRGIMWSAHQPLDRLAPLIVIGARVGE